MAAAAIGAFSTPQARRRRSKSNRRSYCDHNCDESRSGRRRSSANESVGEDGSYLSLDASELIIDADTLIDRSGERGLVTLSWHITEDVNPLDWIGMYFSGEKNPFRYLDYRSHGLRCQTSGQLQWKLNQDLFGRKNHARIRFKYYDGLSGNLRAISPVLLVTLINQKRRRSCDMQQTSNSLFQDDQRQKIEYFMNATLKEISCDGLRKSIIPPQFYVHVALGADGDASKAPSKSACFKTKPVGSVHPRWNDLDFQFSMLPISKATTLRFIIKDKNRPRFYRVAAHGSVCTSDIFTHLSEFEPSYIEDTDCAFTVDMNLSKLSAAPSPARRANNAFTNKHECKLSILARIGIAPRHRTIANERSRSINDRRTTEFPSSSGVLTGTQPNSINSGNDNKRVVEMQQRHTEIAIATNGIMPTTSASSTSFSSASSAGSSGSSAEPGCSKCVLHRVPRLKHSDSGISQSSAEQAIVKNVGSEETSGRQSSVTTTTPNTATSIASAATSTLGPLHHSQTSPSPVRFRPSSNIGFGRAIRPRSLPHTPIKSPRLRRPDTLNVICACCLTNTNLNGHPNGPADVTQEPDQLQSPPKLALVLKNTGTAPRCSRCTELRARWSPSASLASSSSKPALGSSSGVSMAPPIVDDAVGFSSFGSSGSASSAASQNHQTVENYVDILPPFWEARVDSHGRVFYVDHMNKMTSWDRPHGPNSHRGKQVEQARRQLMDKRYLCMRKTVGSAVGRVEAPEGDYSKWPAVLFLSRPDFMVFLHSNDIAKDIYCKSQSVRHIIHRVRKDPSKFERFQYNKDIVSLLNEFADKSAGMPTNWEAKVDPARREFFVDHKNKRTTFIDPRLPLPSTSSSRRRRTRSAPPENEEAEVDPGLTYNERVVNFMRRPDAMETMRRRYATLRDDSKLKRKISTICKVGVPALKKFANDVDLITLLSVCEDDILSEMARSVSKTFSVQDEFDTKLAEFYERLQQNGYGQGPGKLKISARREHLLKDAFEQVMAASRKDLQRNKLNVVFDDEEGLDYGGPSREFFFLISRELFNPYYGLFEYSANDTYTVQISAMSVFVDNYIEWFQFSGRILGLALIHRYLLDTFFTRAFYKFLLRIPCCVSDLESLDNQFYTSLLWLHENYVTADLGLTFSVNEEIGGELMERELMAGGNMVSVTEDNKNEYIERMVKWRLERGVKKQATSLLKGFYEVVDPQFVRMFDARELELVLAGTIEIDIGDWRVNTEYRGGYHDDHIAILWFWQAVERFTNAQRLLLLQFVTGTSSIPYEGFAALRGSHGPKRFTIEKWGSPAGLPRAHTCFNRLDLPPYTSFAALSQKLLTAIEESSSFGIE